MDSKYQQSVIQRYEEVHALSPVAGSEQIDSTQMMSMSSFLSLSLFIFFFVVIFLGFLPLLIERFKNFKRFQTALLLAFVGAALPLSMGILMQRSGFLTRASVLELPQNVQIVNVTPSSFTVKWQTDGKQYGSLRYGLESEPRLLTQVMLETGGLSKKQHHEVLVDNLDAETSYYFEILSGSRWYDNSGALLHVETLSIPLP